VGEREEKEKEKRIRCVVFTKRGTSIVNCSIYEARNEHSKLGECGDTGYFKQKLKQTLYIERYITSCIK
jgi:hypothetical protein